MATCVTDTPAQNGPGSSRTQTMIRERSCAMSLSASRAPGHADLVERLRISAGGANLQPNTRWTATPWEVPGGSGGTVGRGRAAVESVLRPAEQLGDQRRVGGDEAHVVPAGVGAVVDPAATGAALVHVLGLDGGGYHRVG